MPITDLQKRRDYQRNWRARRRAEWFDGKVCVDCGGLDRLELDHVDRTQKVSHTVWSWSRGRREAELAKCVVRCHACHKKKTGKEVADFWKGRPNPLRGLSVEQVGEIRGLLEKKMPHREIASQLGTNRATVGAISRRETYKEIA